MCVAVFPPWCIFFFFIVVLPPPFFFSFSQPRERFFGRGFRICFMTVDFTPGGLSPRKTQGTGYLARTSYGFPGASGKWELLQSWRLPSFLSLVLQVLYLVDQKLRSVFSIMLIGKEIKPIELVLNPVTVTKIKGDIVLLPGRIFLVPLK